MKNKTIGFLLLILLAFITGVWGYRLIKPATDEDVVVSDVVDASPGRGFRHMVDVLELDDSQAEAFRQLETTYRENIRHFNGDLRILERAIIEELSVINPDTAMLHVYADSIGKVQSQIKLLTIQHFLALRDVCNEEQQARLSRLFTRLETSAGRGRGAGYGRGEGMQQGRRHRQTK